MSRTLVATAFAALSIFTAVPGVAHEVCTSGYHMDADASHLLSPRYARDSMSGFGGWPPDYVIECFGREIAPFDDDGSRQPLLGPRG